jgi:hypothetical protein
MALLVAAVTVVGALGVVNLIFSLGVIRRLREHTELLDRLTAGGGAQGDSVMLPPGETVADFVATTMDGERVSRGELVGSTLVGFFSPDCEPCKERLPQFVDHAEHHPGGRRQVLAVIVAQDEDTARPVAAELASVARVVRDVGAGPVPRAFGVQGFPAFALVEPGGMVRASGYELSALAEPAVV